MAARQQTGKVLKEDLAAAAGWGRLLHLLCRRLDHFVSEGGGVPRAESVWRAGGVASSECHSHGGRPQKQMELHTMLASVSDK